MAKEIKNLGSSELEAALQENFLQRNWKKLGVACAAVVVAILGVIAWNAWTEKRNQKAAEALFPCEQLFQAGNYQKALEGDGANCVGLLEVVKQYGGCKTGNVAKLYAGLSYANLKQFEEAKKYLSDFDTKDDALISPAALGALGNVYVQLGENEKGAETLVKAASKADNSLVSPIFLVQAAQVYESLGNADKALKLYEQIRDNYRGSVQGNEVEKYIERIKAGK
ncbi:MAG: tetratricopeptide repeat protein [Bacteroidaceae bacterium]|nr:tetratricopeptide repeat protein [Bacteroidaceae bacterium]